MNAMTDRTYRNGILVEPEEGYSGWTNYPTWAVKLWIDNDQGSYIYWRGQATECAEIASIADGTADSEERAHREAVYELAEQIKDEHEEGYDYRRTAVFPNLASHEVEATVYDDLMSYALGRVNWHEIAESLIQEVKEKADYQASTHGGS